MIAVEVHYNKLKTRGEDKFKFISFKVIGHANQGENYDNIKCCSAVSGVLIGCSRFVLNKGNTELKIEKGLFYYECKSTGFDSQTHYGLNAVLCQLYEIAKLYPQQFSKFDIIEEKEKTNG